MTQEQQNRGRILSYSVHPTRSVEWGELGYRVPGLDPVSSADLDVARLQPGDILLLVGYARNPAEDPIGRLQGRDVWVWHTGIYSEAGRWIVGDHFAGEVIETDRAALGRDRRRRSLSPSNCTSPAEAP